MTTCHLVLSLPLPTLSHISMDMLYTHWRVGTVTQVARELPHAATCIVVVHMRAPSDAHHSVVAAGVVLQPL